MSTALEQAPLFDEAELPAGRELLVPVEEQRHRFTGELVARNVAKYAAIVGALGEGLGVRQIARAFGVSHHTVECIRERESALVATEKERTGRKLRRLVRMSLDALEEALTAGTISAGQLPITAGILIDKSLLWDGQATAIVAHRHELDQEKVRRLFNALQGPLIELAPDSESGEMPPEGQQKALIPPASVSDVVISCPPVAGATTSATSPGMDDAGSARVVEMAGGGVGFDPGRPDSR